MKLFVVRSCLFAMMLTCLLPFASSAQGTYAPGAITTHSGESIRGQIDYKNWKRNPAAIKFKKEGMANAELFTAKEIRSFEVAGEKYVAAPVDIDVRSDDINNLSGSYAVVTRKDTLFLLAIAEGSRSLYFYDDGKAHFYTRSNDEFTLLQYKRYEQQENAVATITANTAYRQQLITYLNDCFNVEQDVSGTAYTLASMRKLFAVYYDCVKTSPTYMQRKETTRGEWGIVAGIQNIQLDFTGDYATISNATFEPATGLAAGLSYDLILPRNRERLSIYNELLVTRQQYTGSSRSEMGPTVYDINTYTIQHVGLRISNMVRYRMLKNNRLFVNAGISNSFTISQKNALVKFHKFYDTETTTDAKVPYEQGRYGLGYQLGIGAAVGPLSIEARYEKSGGMMYYKLVHSNERRAGLYLTYRFR